MSKVAVLKTKPETVLQDYSKLMNLANYKKILPKNKPLVLKLNLSWSLYYPACSTEPWQLEGVLKTLTKDGYKEIYPVENRTVVTDVWKGAKGNKWLPILKKYKQKYYPLTETKWVKYVPKHEMMAMDDIFHKKIWVPEMFLGKNVMHLPTMKTHGHTTMTGAMKNAFGGLITMKRHHCHKDIHKILVDLLAIQKEIHPKQFAVMDGTVAGDGAGPRTMDVKIKNYILASEDQVAIDAISAKMMGFDPMKIGFIKMAHDKGLGIGDPDQIDIVGEDISKVNFKFHTKKSLVIFMDQTLRKKYPIIEPILFHTPLFKMCIFGSEFYHDKFWYPTVGKKNIREFMKTEWGQKFRSYQ
ncbi:MAG: DUF362 domain-containing protein [archaeon]